MGFFKKDKTDSKKNESSQRTSRTENTLDGISTFELEQFAQQALMACLGLGDSSTGNDGKGHEPIIDQVKRRDDESNVQTDNNVAEAKSEKDSGQTLEKTGVSRLVVTVGDALHYVLFPLFNKLKIVYGDLDDEEVFDKLSEEYDLDYQLDFAFCQESATGSICVTDEDGEQTYHEEEEYELGDTIHRVWNTSEIEDEFYDEEDEDELKKTLARASAPVKGDPDLYIDLAMEHVWKQLQKNEIESVRAVPELMAQSVREAAKVEGDPAGSVAMRLCSTDYVEAIFYLNIPPQDFDPDKLVFLTTDSQSDCPLISDNISDEQIMLNCVIYDGRLYMANRLYYTDDNDIEQYSVDNL